ncbi:amino acid permease [Pontiella sulfatireligans]|uniref:Putative amino acid permease YhdG n=1 Tax=Pontiella sulfatireligans TaxID=2750658 RepID=A0A6C2UIS6_9BACT|nr:amino acid permease [Pontiella sulfatireligans]VGO20110.1 putative amino acid permease YhdG [Pontiella sulfatireligans]
MKKGLGFLDVFCIASGAMISSGIFVLPGLAFSQIGPAMILSYFIAGMLALIGVFSVIELATAMPKAGGDYYFLTRSLGPLVGTVAGLLSWFALSLKTAFAVFGLAEVVFLLSGERVPLFATAVPVTAFFVVLNIKGTEAAAKFEVVLVMALLVLMGIYFAIGAPNIQASHFRPFIVEGGGFKAILTTAGFVFVSFGGLLKTATIAEEVHNPRRNIPAGFIAATIAITLLYALLLVVTVGVLPAAELRGSFTPIADTARILAGTVGYVAITIAAVLAFVTTANAGIMSASRYPLALGRDRLLPPIAAKVNKQGSPTVAIVLTGGIILAALLLDIEKLVKAASAVVISSYILSAVAVLVMRRSKLTNYRPTFRVPFCPWLPLFGIVCFSLLVIDMGLAAVEISLGLVVVGLLTYFFYGRKRTDMGYALLHIAQEVMNKELTSDSLEKELYETIHQRDELVHDSFDEILKTADALDLEPGATQQSLLDAISQTLERELSLSEEEIHAKFEEREAQGSCVLTPFVAIPHIIVDGEKLFKILLVRSREGIEFEIDTSVKAFFVIVGSRDMRNMHLKALAAIAHIVQHPEFEKRWATAKNEAQLKDILLLSERVRM